MEIKDRYKDIVKIGDLEIIPTWKQCGEPDPNWSETERWLWDTGDFGQHAVILNSAPQFWERHWIIWYKGECGHVSLEDDGTYTAHIKIEMTRSCQRGFKTLEEAAIRVTGPHAESYTGSSIVFEMKDGSVVPLGELYTREGYPEGLDIFYKEKVKEKKQ